MNTDNVGPIKLRFLFNALSEIATPPMRTAQPPEGATIDTTDGFKTADFSTDPSKTGAVIGAGFHGSAGNLVLPSQVDINDKVDRFLEENSGDKQGEQPQQIRYHLGESSGGQQVVTILHTNDIHGKLTPKGGVGGLVNMSGTINELKQENPNYILVDAGDIAYNPSFSDKNRFNPLPEVMNIIGYDVLGPGNHEWQWESGKYGGVNGNPNPELVDNMKELSAALNFPMVNCNTVLEADGKRPEWLQPFTIKDVGGVKVGVTSICTSDMATSAHPLVADNWKVQNPSTALKQTIPEMKAAGADIIVVLSHHNLNANQNILRQTPGIDIMIGSHDHQTTNDPIMVKDPTGKQVPLIEAFSHTKLVGELDVTYDPKQKKITSIESTLHKVDSSKASKADPQVGDVVNEWAGKRDMEEGGRDRDNSVGRDDRDHGRTNDRHDRHRKKNKRRH